MAPLISDEFLGTTLDPQWAFQSSQVGDNYEVANGLLRIYGSGSATRDAITNTAATTDQTARVQGETPAVSGNVDVAMQLASDVGDRQGWNATLMIFEGGGGNGALRLSCYKTVPASNFYCNFYFSTRPTTGNGATGFNQSVDQAAFSLMTGCPSWLRIQFVEPGATPLAGMPNAGDCRALFSVDGFTWVTISTRAVAAPFTLAGGSTRLSYGKASAGTFGSFYFEQFVDVIAKGTTDLRAPEPTGRTKQVIATIEEGDNALDPAFWQDASQGGDTIGWSGGKLRFSHTLTGINADEGVTATLKYVGPQVLEGGVLLRLQGVVNNSGAFSTLGLTNPLPTPVPAAFTAVSRATNVATATGLPSNHGFKVGNVVNVSGVSDSSFNNRGVAITAVTSTTVSWASTGTDGSSGGGSVVKSMPLDQYVNGPGYGLEIISSGTIRRPIRVDYDGSYDVESSPASGSTQLDERPYFHMKQITAAAGLNLNAGNIILVRLERIGGEDGHQRVRIKSWQSVGNLAADIAAEPSTWDYLDAQDDVVKGLFGPVFALSQNGSGKTGTASMDVSYLEFYEYQLEEPVVAQTVNENLDLPGGTQPSDFDVEVALVGSGGAPIEGYHAGTGTTILGANHPTLDGSAQWSLLLQPNSEITPGGTAYRRTVTGPGVNSQAFFTVPASGTPHQMQTILSAPPGTIPEGALATHAADLTLHGGGREIAYAEITSNATWTAVDTSFAAIAGLSIAVPQTNRPVFLELYLPSVTLSTATGYVMAAIMPVSLQALETVGIERVVFTAASQKYGVCVRARLAPNATGKTWVGAANVGAAATGTAEANALQRPYIRAWQA